MVQKGEKENENQLVNDNLKEKHNLNAETVNTFKSIYLSHDDGDKLSDKINSSKKHLEATTNDYLDVNENNEDYWDCSNNVSQTNSNCSSNSSTTGNLIRNLNLDDVEFNLEQEENRSDLIIKVRLKKLKIKDNISYVKAKSSARSICLELEDLNAAFYSLKIKPLYDSIREITQIQFIEKDCFEIRCNKELAMKWQAVLERKELLNKYVMNKFEHEYKRKDEITNDFNEEAIAAVAVNQTSSDNDNENNNDENSDPFFFNDRELRRAGSQSNLDEMGILMGQRRLRARDRDEKQWSDERSGNSNWNSSIIPYNNSSLTNSIKIGYTGLDNLGNTCFMNTVLQCLSNTDELRDYFLDNNFNSNINRTNPFGSNGNVAIGFSNLVKHLWSGEHASYSPDKFKDFISTKMNKFEGNAQEDSVEFMEIFLDLLHEDLNRVDRTKKIIVDVLPKEEDQLTDSELANEMWIRHRKFNDSLIVDIFHGQLKSHLKCSVCAKNSLTFDPFLFLPVPLPKPQITYTVFFFNLDYEKKPLKVSVTNSHDVKCNVLLNQISDRFKVKATNLRLMISSFNCFDRLVDNGDAHINQFDTGDLFIFQIKDEQDCKEKVFNFYIKQYRLCTDESYFEFETNNSKYWNSNDWMPDEQSPKQITSYHSLGRSFLVSLTESELNYQNLSNALLKRSRHSIDINLFEVKIEENSRRAEVEEVPSSKKEDNNDLDKEKEEEQEKQEQQEEEQSNSNDNNNNSESLEEMNDSRIEIKVKPHMLGKREVRNRVRKVENESINSDIYFNILNYLVKDSKLAETKQIDKITDFEMFSKSLSSMNDLIMQWKDDRDTDFRIRITSKELDHSANYYELMNRFQQDKNATTLEDCLEMFTDEEELSLEDYWHCPNCKKPQKASKRLTIWRLPKILIIQLKRFSYKQFTRDKIDNFIQFPVYDLDLKRFCSDSNQADLDGKTFYDLYGVINHFGGIYGGHYTASAKTIYKNKEYGLLFYFDF